MMIGCIGSSGGHSVDNFIGSIGGQPLCLGGVGGIGGCGIIKWGLQG